MRLGHHLRRLRHDLKGNVAIMTAATLVGASLMVGGSVDVFRHEMLRKRAQNAVDRCVLAAASLSQREDPQTVCTSFIEAAGLELPPDAQWQITDQDGYRSICLAGNYELPTTFLRLASVEEMDVPVQSCAEERERHVEISLMLDMSASMSRNVTGTTDKRMDLLKPAASQFVRTMLDTEYQRDLTSISIVPYAGQVNVGRGMFAHLAGNSYTRRHEFSSCFQFERSDYDGGMPNFSRRKQVAHFTRGSLRQYGGILGEFDQSKRRWKVPGNKTYFHKVDGEWRRYAEIWQCPDDPHGYLRRPFDMTKAAEDGLRYDGSLLLHNETANDRVIEDKVRGTAIVIPPKSEIVVNEVKHFDHQFECDRVFDRVWEKNNKGVYDNTDRKGRDFNANDARECDWLPKETRVPYRNYNDALKDDMIGLDEDRTQVSFLQNDPDLLVSQIEQFRMYDSTGTHIAMKWGNLLLDPAFNHTFKRAVNKGVVESDFPDRPRPFGDPNTYKFMVLMTDGRITSQYDLGGGADVAYGNFRDHRGNWVERTNVGYARDKNGVSLTDRRNVEDFRKICQAAKNQGVVVFTIGFDLVGEANADTRKELEDCASSEAHYFAVGVDIDQAFRSIAATIQRVRLTS